MRAPDKRKILIDIGNIPPAEIDTYMQRVIDRMKKTPLVDPKTGDYNLRYNMMNITEDFYLPVRGKDSGTDITNLPGLQFNAIEDIEYLRNKLMAAFKVPKSFMGYEEDSTGKASLAAQDVRFARTIERIQRIMVSELTKIAIIHLYVQGFTDEELVNFEIEMSSPSVIFEQEKINLWKEKIQLSKDIVDSKFLSRDWIYHNILNISPDDAKEEKDAITQDEEWLGTVELAKQQASEPKQPEEPPPETTEPAAPEETPAEEPEGALAEPNEILSALDDSSLDAELEEARMGRPKKGATYGQDSHVRGRDPLGHKENMDVFRGRIARRTPSRKSALSLENTGISRLIKQLKTHKEIDTKDFLNEENILNNE